MNKVFLSIASVAAAAAIAISIPAIAQQKVPDATPPAPVAKPIVIPNGVFYKGQQVDQYSAKERLIGAKVVTKAGEPVGDIEDLIMASGAHKIDTVIIGVGGVLGVGEKKIGVAHKALVFGMKDGKRTVTLDTTKEVLGAVQPYKYAEAPKTLLQKAGEATKEAAKKAGDATKGAVEKAKEAVKGKPADAPKPQ
jgi:sporulation protein YlmC with PRC-barrel domain